MYLRLLLASVFGLISSRIILDALGEDKFGLFSVVGGIVFLIAFLNNVMVSTTYRYIAFELGTGNLEEVNKVFNRSFIIHIFLAAALVLFSETLGVYYINTYLNVEPALLNDALFVFRFTIFSTFIYILSVPFQGLITAKENFTVIASAEIVKSFLALTGVIFVYFYSGNRLRLYAILISLTTMIPPLTYYLYSKRKYASIIKWGFQRGKEKYKEMIAYSGWIMFGAAASAGEIHGSALIINSFFGTVINASYGIANQVNNLVKMFSQSLNQAVVPQITKSYSGGQKDRTLLLVIFSSKYSFFLMLLPALPIMLDTEFILGLWLQKVPEYSAVFIQLMIINALLAAMNAGIPAAVQATGKIKYFQIIMSTLTLLGLPAAYFLFQFGTPPYVLLICFTSIAVFNLFVRLVLLKKLIQFNVKEFVKRAYFKMIVVLLPLAPFFLIQQLFPVSLYRFIFMSLFSVVTLLIIIYSLGMERKEKDFVKNILKTISDRIFRNKK